MTQRPVNANDLINALNLEPHVEGGFFRRTYQADHRGLLETTRGPRYLMTSIYYLLTAQSPVGQFHFNQSDILHYFHTGDAIEYSLIHADGSLETLVMGSDVLASAITRTGRYLESVAITRWAKWLRFDQRSGFTWV